jgi:cytochrome P450/NADPH-cytochrome P450 reductase
MPAFSTTTIRNMFDGMFDISMQLVHKWERFGADYVIDPTQDFTRLTFDTIALCSMSYR